MYEMRTIAIDDPGVCQFVCLSRGFTRLRYANTTERIRIAVLFGVKTLVAEGTLY